MRRASAFQPNAQIMPHDVGVEDRTRAPQYSTNWSAVIGVIVLAIVIAIGTWLGGLWKPTAERPLEFDPVVRLAEVRETPHASREAAPVVVVAEEKPEVFRTEWIGPAPIPALEKAQVELKREARRALASASTIWVEVAEELEARRIEEARFQRLQKMSETELRWDLLAKSKELVLERPAPKKTAEPPAPGAPRRPAVEEDTRSDKPVTPDSKAILEKFAAREELQGVPFREAEECHSSKLGGEILGTISTAVRTASALASRGRFPENDPYRPHPIHELIGTKSKEWSSAQHVSGLVQMLQSEDRAIREVLVGQLSTIKDAKGTKALAERAVFELDSGVREQAIKLLGQRSAGDYRPVLLSALRYPWGPASAHAAEALVALKDGQAVTDLIDLLDAPNPELAHQNAKQEWVVKELTKVNHLRNCQLCHPVSASKLDPVVGLVPIEGSPLPQVYYHSRRGGGEFVRADVTYLRQDFSLTEKLEKQAPWPDDQRMDYFVRERKASPEEVEAAKSPARSNYFPQRQAVLFALKGLTGEMHGDSAEAWREWLSR